ncbi:DNA primase catalytic core [Humibacillus xanthopallidus]|uniref:DNA primase catalytic core n=1 Tax=Humibacillus xanthopallidus TaxID=412689 RepID=A0A543PWY0_9MICO|nr:MobF family relaxase [Humibacillus xanthopallidus]TQN48584.1 DNA primase catalytic core [Humibacillus xanthopallidus]
MSIHKLTAGSGYDYLTRQVAAHDATDKGHTGLASYYAQKGETPGVWVGSGMAGLEGLDAGDVVTQEQMQALFGSGHHPLAQQRLDRLAGPDLTVRDHQAVTRLGAPYKVYSNDVSAFRIEVARRIHDRATELGSDVTGDLGDDRGDGSDAVVPLEERARIRTEVATEFFRAEHGRDPASGSDGAREIAATIAKHSRPRTTAVAGYDLTFSPVKSVSTLWAVADPTTAAAIERAHLAAVGDALRFLEEHALFTRTGTNGVRQVEVRGLVATAFTHRDSRAGDPDLHTHVAVANKVQTLDGRWLSIDGRVLFKANVSASETYNTALEKHLHAGLGLRFTERNTGRIQDGTSPRVDGSRKRPVREVAGVDPRLNERWSTRRAAVVARRSDLAQAFQRDHGRPPTAVESIQLAQQATLETRQPKKDPHTLAEQRATWRQQAIEVLGDEPALTAMIAASKTPEAAGRPPVRRVDAAWMDATAASIVATLQAIRSTWQVWHVRAEAQRRVRSTDPADLAVRDVDAVVGLLVDDVLVRRSVRLTDQSDGIAKPAQLRRRDDSSVYTVHGADQYSSAVVLAAEQRLLAAAGSVDGATVDTRDVDLALLESAANGVTLNAGQAALVRGMSTSGARLQLAIAPAGAGKTTALRALSTTWANAGGHVIGLAPSAAAAAVVRDQISTLTPVPTSIPAASSEPAALRTIGTHGTVAPVDPGLAVTDTLAKLTWSIDHGDLPDWAKGIDAATLVLVDEAGMADTLTLDTVVQFVTTRGGSVRLIGDDQQLAAIGAGGVLRDIAHTHGALRLTELMRFTDPAEAAATLALRDGAPEALGFYLDTRRVHVGDPATTTEDVFTAWQTDTARGLDAIMLAPTRELVAQLNQRARTHRLHSQPAGDDRGTAVTLADGNAASVGDLVITRSNDRRLRLTASDWVKNGDRWTVLDVGGDGRLRVQHTRHRHTITLPAGYVTASTELGYATTVHAAQGVSADTMHGLATGQESRQQLYTMLTRGRVANHVYVQVVGDGDPHTAIHPDTLAPPTATDILETILARDASPASATTQLRDAADPALLLGRATARYTDAVHYAAEDLLGPDTVRRLEHDADHAVPGLTDQPAWPTLRAHLILLAAHDRDPLTALRTAAFTRELDTAADAAAVIDWRLEDHMTATTHELDADRGDSSTGPLPWLPGIPPALGQHPTWGEYLTRRAELVSTLAAQVKDTAYTRTPAWVTHTAARPDPAVLADVQVWRAATQVPDTDMRPTGPPQLAKAAALWQRRLTTALQGSRSPALQEWQELLHAAAPGIRHDDFTPTLAERLAAISRAGIDARGLLRRAVDDGALPDDHPAAALWWRISRHISPAVAADLDPHRRGNRDALTTSWVPRLTVTYGPTRAEELQASPWWPALVTSIDHALHRGWTLDDLLGTNPSHNPGADDRPAPAPEAGARDLDDCQAMVWRITVLTDPPPPPEDLDDDQPHEDELPPTDIDLGVGPHSEAPTPEQWPDLLNPGSDSSTKPRDSGAKADADGAAAPLDFAVEAGAAVEVRLQLAAMVRETMGHLEPADDDVEAMVARAALWDDSPVSRERMLEINQLTLGYFRDRLPGSWAEQYLRERFSAGGESPPGPLGPSGSLTAFAPGYAPAGWTSLVAALRRAGVTDEEMLAAGVASRARTGRLIDRFRDRVMLPITHDGDVLGFVGRRHPALDDDPGRGPGVPKYLNTADTPLFHKGAHLYGIPPWPLPQDAALVLVEGPMDAIAVTVAGGGAFVGVATLGTSLTHQQAAQLASMHRPLIVATDGDLPGRVAAERDFWMLAPHGLAPAVARFPDGSDPADVLTREGPPALLDTLHRARPLASLLVEERLANLTGVAALQQASQILAAQPPTAWDAGSRHVVQRLEVSLLTARACLAGHAEHWNRDPRATAQQQLAAIREVRSRLESIPEQPPVDRWLELARELDPRLPAQSDWTALAGMLDHAHHAGIDVAGLCRDLIDEQPLQDLPAQELRHRLAVRLPDDPALYELPFNEPEPASRQRTGAAMQQLAGRDRPARGRGSIRR